MNTMLFCLFFFQVIFISISYPLRKFYRARSFKVSYSSDNIHNEGDFFTLENAILSLESIQTQVEKVDKNSNIQTFAKQSDITKNLEAVHAQLAIFMALKGSFDILPSQECTSAQDENFESIMKDIEQLSRLSRDYSIQESDKIKIATLLEDAAFVLPIRDVRAASTFQHSINLYEGSANAWLGLGLTTLHKLDDRKAAQKSIPFLQKAISISIENTGNTSINTGTIHYHLSSALLLCDRYIEAIEHANKVINCISANKLDSGILKAQSMQDCSNTHILNGEDKDALRMIILQLEIGPSQGIGEKLK
jgi:hypothetical protein